MIQIDMQMPTNCLDCPACNEYLMCAIPVNGRKWGENDVREFGQGRPEWCPMKEQKTVVRCKDCTDRRVCVIAKKHDGLTENKFDPDWFCADGVKTDG